MVNVREHYNLVEIDGKVCRVNKKEIWDVVEVDSEDGVITINDCDKVSFIVESSGEMKTGTISKIQGNGSKIKFTISPVDSDCEEIWKAEHMVSGTLKIVER